MAKIIIKVGKFGDTKVSVEGEHGEGCIAATATVEAALAGSPQRTLKPEYDETPTTETAQAVGQQW